MTTRRSQIAGKASFKLAVTSAFIRMIMLTCTYLCGGSEDFLENSNSLLLYTTSPCLCLAGMLGTWDANRLQSCSEVELKCFAAQQLTLLITP